MLSDEEVRAIILNKLFLRKCWGGKHTSFDNLKRGIKVKELGKEGLKRIDKNAKELIRWGFILTKPTHYGLEISLNPQQAEKIISLIKKFY